MLDFILYNPIFEILLSIPFIINILTISLLDYKQQSTDINKKIKSNEDKIYKIKITIIFIVLIIMTILLVKIFSQYLLTILLLVTMFVSLIKSIATIYKNDNNFSLDNKYYNTFATIVFIMFFASHIIPIYMNTFQYVNHFTKELLLLLFINLKLILFVFLLLINISVLISNVTEMLTQKQKNFFTKILSIESKSYKLIQYDFLLYKKKMSNKYLIIDSIIYTILAPITILLNFLLVIILKLILKFIHIIKYIINKFIEYKKNRNLITKRITYISIIISLSLSYIIVIMNDNLFLDTTKELFAYFSTVILIPLIYDSIKNK